MYGWVCVCARPCCDDRCWLRRFVLKTFRIFSNRPPHLISSSKICRINAGTNLRVYLLIHLTPGLVACCCTSAVSPGSKVGSRIQYQRLQMEQPKSDWSLSTRQKAMSYVATHDVLSTVNVVFRQYYVCGSAVTAVWSVTLVIHLNFRMPYLSDRLP